nr:MAG TPA: hypothetical protein [Caudoviricetes sp.]
MEQLSLLSLRRRSFLKSPVFYEGLNLLGWIRSKSLKMMIFRTILQIWTYLDKKHRVQLVILSH